MLQELQDKEIFEQARHYAFDYMDRVEDMDVFPSKANLENLTYFDEPLANESTSAKAILEQLNEYGSPAIVAQTGGRYFGFVNGGVVPVSLGVK